MRQDLYQAEITKLFQAVLTLKTEDECARFFADICTIHELESMAQRLDVAARLREGMTYAEISKLTGASTATISRVGRALNHGALGYDVVLKRQGTDAGREQAGQDDEI